MTAPPPPGPRGEEWGRLNHELWRADMFAFLETLAEQHGDVVGFDLGRTSFILVNGAREVRALFLQRGDRLRKPEFVKDSNRGHWGDGLTTLEGAAWKDRRRVLRPSFTTHRVGARLDVVGECVADMLVGWVDGAVVDLLHEVRALTARIAARTVLDADVEGLGDGEGRSGLLPFSEAYGEDYASAPGGDATAPLVMVRPRAPRRMDATVRIIDERLASREDRGDVLSHLVQIGLPREAIVGELIQMLYAGHHTIPSSLVSFWSDIAAHGLDTRVRAEASLLDVHGPSAGSRLGSLLGSHLAAILRESMRVHPPAPILYREVERPFELGGFTFDQEVGVWVSPQLLHHDPRYFPEPHRFLPERFEGEGLDAEAECVYLPFGTGPRTCIGNLQALQQMIWVAANVARRFVLTPANEGSTQWLVRDLRKRNP